MACSDKQLREFMLRMQDECHDYDNCVQYLFRELMVRARVPAQYAPSLSETMCMWPERHQGVMISFPSDRKTVKHIHAELAAQMRSVDTCEVPKEIRGIVKEYFSTDEDLIRYYKTILTSLVRRGRLAGKIIMRRWKKVFERHDDTRMFYINVVHVGESISVPVSLCVINFNGQVREIETGHPYLEYFD